MSGINGNEQNDSSLATILENAQGKGAWVRVIMGKERKHQIREICKQLGLPIVKIVRVRIGTLRLGTLKPPNVICWRWL